MGESMPPEARRHAFTFCAPPLNGTSKTRLFQRRVCLAMSSISNVFVEQFVQLTSMDERELQCPEARPLVGWRLFRMRRSENGFVLSAPLIRDTDFERFPSRTIDATCYDVDHPAPAPGCRCGLYAAIEGTLDSLSG